MKTETMILNYLNIKDAHKLQDEARIEHRKVADTEKPNLQKHGEVMHEKSDEACWSVANMYLTTDGHHCETCAKTYKCKRDLVRHIKNIHEKNTNVKYKLQTEYRWKHQALKNIPTLIVSTQVISVVTHVRRLTNAKTVW